MAIQLAAATVLGAAWLASLGPVLAVIGVMAAKHILVGLLLAGMDQTAPGAPA